MVQKMLRISTRIKKLLNGIQDMSNSEICRRAARKAKNKHIPEGFVYQKENLSEIIPVELTEHLKNVKHSEIRRALQYMFQEYRPVNYKIDPEDQNKKYVIEKQ